MVTKDIPDGVVVAGVPAKVIGDYLEFAKKRREEGAENKGGILEKK